MTPYAIEHGVPVPPPLRGKGRGHGNQFPFAEMAVGDSFFIARTADYQIARCAADGYGKRHGVKFVSRLMAGGLRIWRVA